MPVDTPASKLNGPRFLPRELGILAFNRRVFEQAENRRLPILERLRFLCIVFSNLDEFFEIRVAELKERIKLGNEVRQPGEGTASEVLHAVGTQAHALVAEQYRLWNQDILPTLARHEIVFLAQKDWSRRQREWLLGYFRREMMPLLTPIGLDPAHPFPRVLNKSLNFAVQLAGRDAFGRNSGTAIVQAPRLLPRVIKLPPQLADGNAFVLLTSILEAFVEALFESMTVLGSYPFRVTRNSDLFVNEEEISDVRAALAGELPQRHFGDSVRLEVAEACPPEMEQFLLLEFQLSRDDLYRADGPVNLVRLMYLPDLVDVPSLKYRRFDAGIPKALERHKDLFRVMRDEDILLHHPFQSFDPVLQFIEQATEDPSVVAIKQTVYRTSTDSVLMRHLIDAARRGKEVTVVVELLARFDEQANLDWATQLEEVGAHVVYGVVGRKTHAKMTLIIRRENRKLQAYAHLSTGNYHPRTARRYTDFGLLTSNPAICQDVNEVFKQLTGLGRARKLHHLWLSPFTLHDRLIAAIARETKHAKANKPARVIAKINDLTEHKVIERLYAASRAGVRIDLIVRGTCVLRPGVRGLSENIRVRSIVGRFLEHSRIFYFLNDGAEDVLLSSADWMERNLLGRIEIAFPILDPKLKRRVINEGLKAYLADGTQAWDMIDDGSYRRCKTRGAAAQERLLATLAKISP